MKNFPEREILLYLFCGDSSHIILEMEREKHGRKNFSISSALCLYSNNNQAETKTLKMRAYKEQT